jgi:hypothetical protein
MTFWTYYLLIGPALFLAMGAAVFYGTRWQDHHQEHRS